MSGGLSSETEDMYLEAYLEKLLVVGPLLSSLQDYVGWFWFVDYLYDQFLVPEETDCISLQCQAELHYSLLQVFTMILHCYFPHACLWGCLCASQFPCFFPSKQEN